MKCVRRAQEKKERWRRFLGQQVMVAYPRERPDGCIGVGGHHTTLHFTIHMSNWGRVGCAARDSHPPHGVYKFRPTLLIQSSVMCILRGVVWCQQ